MRKNIIQMAKGKRQKGKIFKYKCVIISAVFITAAISPSSQAVSISSNAGTSSAQFLKLEMGGRHAAMGGTYAAYGHDVFTLWGQPAALAVAPSAWQIGFQHTEWFQGVSQEYAGITSELGAKGRVGLVVNTVAVDNLLRTTDNANGQLAAVGGTFASRDLGISLHYGVKMNEYLSVGGAIRYITSELDNVKADAVAGDIGVRMDVRDIEGLTIGLAVTNLGTGLKYLNQRNDLPWAIRGGGAYRIPKLNLLLAADVVKFADRDVDAGAGAEWSPIEMLKLRAGYRTQGRDVGEGLTAGVGFNFSGLELDYAYVPFGPLGESHRISAGYLFGGGRASDSELFSSPETNSVVRTKESSRNVSSNVTEPRTSRTPQPIRDRLEIK